ncbi:hypothetical protein [Streptomyces sp. M2CJ-2]|uniref:hypothetical protein n=1 Tax=Streptomyces sp. M2CJ-2 TaxID=2803948 RepID=UPI001F3C4A70|nr:hypothetical protein [Streptomyces sp. M2CJ-2]
MELDVDWVTDPETTGPRNLQLLLIYYGIAPTHAQPLKKYGRRTVGGRERLTWVEKERTRLAPTRDDPAVLPPAIRGQLALFPWRRQLSIDVCRRILQRPLRGWDDIVEHTATFAAETGISKPMQRKLHEMLRLALAVRDAKGDDLVDEMVLEDIPNYIRSVRAILARAGMLRPWVEPPRPPRTRRRRRPPAPSTRPYEPTPRSCTSCDCWFAAPQRHRCMPCADLARRTGARPTGTCTRCHRPELPVIEGRCQGCRLHVAVHGPDAEREPWTQLWFGEPFPTRILALRRQGGPPGGGDDRPVSPHLTVPGQQVLFDMRRNWSALASRPVAELPALTHAAERLLAELDHVIRDRQWEASPATSTKRTLTILLSWLGAEAPLREADLQDLAQTRASLTARRATHFLEARGLLIPDAELRRDTHERRLEQELAELPETIADELDIWIKAVHGKGRWEHDGRSFRSIFRYYKILQPLLDQWIAEGVESLREISHDDVKAGIASRKGTPARAIHIVLRNVFKALRQERVIFRDPTRGLVFSGIETVPPSVPSDQLAGLLGHARNAFERFVIVLVCVHALNGTDLRGLLLADLNLPRERLVVRRPGLRHVIYLDELTYRCASEWTRERHRRWPATPNPHLLINRWTAADAQPAISSTTIGKVFTATGLPMQTLRQDRILHEAFETEDPLHLMRLFGINDTTAMRYIKAAHPERTAHLPR